MNCLSKVLKEKVICFETEKEKLLTDLRNLQNELNGKQDYVEVILDHTKIRLENLCFNHTLTLSYPLGHNLLSSLIFCVMTPKVK